MTYHLCILPQFLGSARMGLPLDSFAITGTEPAFVGETVPSSVEVELSFSLSQIRSDLVKREWSQLRQHDIVFVLSIRKAKKRDEVFSGNPRDLSTTEFAEAYGVCEIRGIEVRELADEDGNVLSDVRSKFSAAKVRPGEDIGIGNVRTLRGYYDPAQYKVDSEQLKIFEGVEEDGVFHMIMRRNPKENNFKAVLVGGAGDPGEGA